MIFMFFGHPGSRFSVRGLSKPRDFYVFRASRIPIQCSRFEQTSWFLCFSGSRVSTKHSRLSGTLVFLLFFGVQDPNQGQGLSGLVAPEKPSFCCNRVPFSSKSVSFVATGCNFPRKTMVLLQQGTIFLEKLWFCCNRVPFSTQNNRFFT